MLRPSRRLLLLALVLIPLSVAAQLLHPSPQWPTDDEFLSVNQAVEAACKRYSNVEEQLVWALIWEESKYDPLAVGLKGEVGLGQLMPETARVLGVQDRTNITESINASVRHLSYLLKKYKNNIRLVLAAYNAGEPAVDRCRCVPAASRAYVHRVDQNRFFARRIVDYVHKTVLPSADQEARVKQLERQLAEARESVKIDASATARVVRVQAELQNVRAEADALRDERDRLRTELQRENSLGAQALAMTESLRKRLDDVEKQIASSGRPQSNSEAGSELEGIRTEIANLKAAIQNRNFQDSETQQRIAELSAAVAKLSDKPVPVVAPNKSSGRSPLIALVAASHREDRVEPDASFTGALQEALLRRGLSVNVELQTAEFVSRNLDSLLAGRGDCLRKVRAKRGPNWDYVVVVRFTGKPGQNDITDTSAYVVTADSRLYTNKGNLVAMRTFSEVGAGFSEAQARESATLRLGQSVGDYLSSAVPR